MAAGDKTDGRGEATVPARHAAPFTAPADSGSGEGCSAVIKEKREWVVFGMPETTEEKDSGPRWREEELGGITATEAEIGAFRPPPAGAEEAEERETPPEEVVVVPVEEEAEERAVGRGWRRRENTGNGPLTAAMEGGVVRGPKTSCGRMAGRQGRRGGGGGGVAACEGGGGGGGSMGSSSFSFARGPVGGVDNGQAAREE